MTAVAAKFTWNFVGHFRAGCNNSEKAPDLEKVPALRLPQNRRGVIYLSYRFQIEIQTAHEVR